MIFILFFKSSIRGITLLPFILIALFLMGAETLSGGIRPISDLHENNSLGVPVLLDSIVQVQGIVTVSNQLGNISYIQDTTGGVAVFDIDFVDSVQIGDILIVTGKLSQFNNSISKNDGLTRLINVTINSIIETGVEPEYKVVKASDIGTEGDGGIELIEGELIRVNGVSLSGGSNTWPPNGSSSATDGTGSLTIFSDIDSDVAFSSKPRGSFDIIGVLDQFDVDSPYTSGYRIIPRFTADIIEKISPVFSSALRVVEVGSTWVELAWSTEDSSFGSVRFTKEGSNSADEQKTGLTDGSHKFVVDGLASSTFYYARVSAWFRSDTTLSTEVFFLTSSPPESSGEIRVFFNKEVDTTYAIPGNNANGNASFRTILINRINDAEHSIDLSLYSLSLDEISTALIAAKERGVAIRFVYEDRSTQSAVQTLINAGIQVIKDDFGANDGNGLMHNKFFIFDGRNDASASNDWVLTGSANWTSSGVGANMQNLVLIQDRSLAKVYTREFNEMWGSVTDTPNADSSKFSSNKSDNIPHLLNIGGRRVEVYMSPTDGVTSKISKRITAAKESLYFCILAYTRDDIASAMRGRFNNIPGFHLRGIFDRSMDPNVSVYPAMINWGVDVYLDGESGTLHHKYMVIDGFNTAGTPVVITGSHNWSTAAETRNNENTIIIYDSLIANQFVQEFAARYKYASGDTLPIPSTIAVTDENKSFPTEFTLSQNYPNPFNPVTTIGYSIPNGGNVTLTIYDILGREIFKLSQNHYEAGYYRINWDASNFSSGIYFYRIRAGDFVHTRKMVLLK